MPFVGRELAVSRGHDQLPINVISLAHIFGDTDAPPQRYEQFFGNNRSSGLRRDGWFADVPSSFIPRDTPANDRGCNRIIGSNPI